MLKNILICSAALALLSSCSNSKSGPHPQLGDLDSRGVYHPLDNETDPDKVENWFTKGPSNHVEGVDAERAYYDFHLNLNAPDVIVAIIDSGVDINHEDLKDRIWINQAEAQGLAGIDDDSNGFIDDIHGWNFLGGHDAQGNNVDVSDERSEATRQLAHLHKLQVTLSSQGKNLSTDDQMLLNQFNQEVTGDRNVAQFQLTNTQSALSAIATQYNLIQNKININFDQLTIEDIQKFSPNTTAETDAKAKILAQLNNNSAQSVQRLQIRAKTLNYSLEYILNENFDPRAQIIHDDPDDFSQTSYGNNDVTGPDALHGTHVAGIIAANRDNGIGIDGIAENAKIMILRAVPNGDEYDKDIYLSVKYAVDNGARVINMSFGKTYSPHKDQLDQIFQYAASKGVVIVHSAGNSAANNDSTPIFPNRFIAHPTIDTEIKTWIEVGASTRYDSSQLVASFSNFGQHSVDIFAPGADIKSTTPGNTYTILSGTSMASPAVTGVVALLMSQKPNLTGEQIRQVLLDSARSRSSLLVESPSTMDFVSFDTLCKTGGVADSYAAIKKILSL